MASSLPSPHFAIFPFLSQGHTIPLLQLSRLLHSRSAAVTIFLLPFPVDIPGVPAGVENTHKLPSISAFVPFVFSLKLMQKSFENALESLDPPVSCIISDLFLGFTLQAAQKHGVPRFVFMGTGAFSCTMYQVLGQEKPHSATKSMDESFLMPGFPGLELTRNCFDPPFSEVEPSGPYAEFMGEQIIAMAKSHGFIVNSFYEMEQRYVDYWDSKIGPKMYCLGPLCAAAQSSPSVEKPFYVRFLDEKLGEGKPVLYVAFGTQAEVSPEQFREICEGLEKSEVSFLWVIKSEMMKHCVDFQEKVKKRGIVVEEWVDQAEILKHEGVRGFVSHCGWNSVLESICGGVPIAALPFMAEQHLNAKLVVEELGVGLRMMPSGGSARGNVAAAEVERVARELLFGEDGAEARRKMAECRGEALHAMNEGGSSRRTLDLLVHDASIRNFHN